MPVWYTSYSASYIDQRDKTVPFVGSALKEQRERERERERKGDR